jgi:hypothetical protein
VGMGDQAEAGAASSSAAMIMNSLLLFIGTFSSCTRARPSARWGLRWESLSELL